MNWAEYIANLKATRADKAKRLTELMTKSATESRTMDTAESEEYDTIKNDLKGIDAQILRAQEQLEIERADAATATPVDDSTKRKQAATPQRLNTLQVKNTQKLDGGMAFARFARVKALAHLGIVNNSKNMAEVAKAVYPDDDKLLENILQKANVPAASTGSATWAGNLINEGGAAFADFIEYLRPRTLLGQISPLLRRLPFDTPVLVQGSAAAAKWVKEGAAKPLTSWTYTRTKLAPLKVATIAVATKETLMRASQAADTLIRDELTRSVGAAIDGKFISDDAAVTDESPAGILQGVSQLTLSGGTTVADIRCDIATFLTALADENLSLSGSFWVMSERIAIALSLIANEVGASAFPGITPNGGTFAGLPVYVTSYAGTDSTGSVVALIKGDEIFLGDEDGIQMSMSDQASLLMTDDANENHNSTTPTGTSVVSLWQTNSVGFLVERFINFVKRRNAAVAWARVGWSACVGS
jgi:HK97 family phage major capsid protein